MADDLREYLEDEGLLDDTPKRGRGRPSKAELRATAPRCGKNNRQGQPCQRPLGWGTDHPGEGPCKLHGGATPKPTLAVAEDSLEFEIQRYMDDPDVFSLTKDLAVLRTLRDRQLTQYEEAPTAKEQNESLYALNGIITNIVRSAEKFQNMMMKSNFALSVAQARQLRETMRKILVEEATALQHIVEPISAEIAGEIESWGDRVSMRLQNELVVENVRDDS